MKKIINMTFTVGYVTHWNMVSPSFMYVISNKTIKKLSVTCLNYRYYGTVPRNISFDTPNVVDFNYSDYLRRESPQCHLDSLAKATLDLHFFEDDKRADVTDLISGLHNVKTLHLTSSTVEVSTCVYGQSSHVLVKNRTSFIVCVSGYFGMLQRWTTSVQQPR